jgi:ABC-type transporter Mla subunit MlaD
VLRQAGEANRQLVEHQMTPLFTGFQESLADYRGDQEVYRSSAAALSGGVTDLTTAASGLAEGVGSYTGAARAIDEKLALIATTQTDLGERIGAHSADLTAATAELRGVAELMAGDMRRDIETLTRNVVDAGSSLGTVEKNLAATSTALVTTTRAIEAGAAELASAAAAVDRAAETLRRAAGTAPAGPRPGFWARLFGRY